MATATRTGVTSYATPTDCDIVITRVVDAPRRWSSRPGPTRCTSPLAAWPGGLDHADLRDRSSARWLVALRLAQGRRQRRWRCPGRCGRSCRRSDSSPPSAGDRIGRRPSTPSCSPSPAGGRRSRSRCTYPTKEARDAALETGMKDGMDQSFVRLDALLPALWSDGDGRAGARGARVARAPRQQARARGDADALRHHRAEGIRRPRRRDPAARQAARKGP